MRITAIFDKYKGCLTSRQAAEAALLGARDTFPDAELCAYECADGGDGMAECLLAAGKGERIEAETVDALGRPLKAAYTLNTATREAYIDLAAASGVRHLAESEKTPMKSSTFGTGLLIADAAERGAATIWLGLGGSATNDAGFGALQALGAEFFDGYGNLLPEPFCGEMLKDVSSITLNKLRKKLKNTKIILLCDVENPFTGPNGAVAVYSGQKGATEEMKRELEKGMLNAGRVMKNLGFTDVFQLPGAGAAGGAGGGFAALAGAEIRRGAESLLQLTGAAEAIASSDIILTGEGHSDRQTLCGKLPYAVMKCARAQGIPTLLLSGKITDATAFLSVGFAAAKSINSPMKRDKTLAPGNPLSPTVAAGRLRQQTAALLSEIFENH